MSDKLGDDVVPSEPISVPLYDSLTRRKREDAIRVLKELSKTEGLPLETSVRDIIVQVSKDSKVLYQEERPHWHEFEYRISMLYLAQNPRQLLLAWTPFNETMRQYIVTHFRDEFTLATNLIPLVMHIMAMRLREFFPDVAEDNLRPNEAIDAFERHERSKIEQEGWGIVLDEFQLRPFLKLLWLCGNNKILGALEKLTLVSEHVENVVSGRGTLEQVPAHFVQTVEKELIMFGICDKSWAKYLNSISQRLKLDFFVSPGQSTPVS